MILRQDELKFSRRWVKILPPLPWYTNFREQKFWKSLYQGNGRRILTKVKILPPLHWYTNFREQKFWKLEYEGNGGRILTERSDRWNSADQRLTGTPNLNLIPDVLLLISPSGKFFIWPTQQSVTGVRKQVRQSRLFD